MMITENALEKLSGLTRPAEVLIEKISNAVGAIFKPQQLVRVAKAEATAERIRAESQIQITDLQQRALHRFIEEEARRQANIEDITRKALPLLDAQSSPQEVTDDWITNFFDKCRIVSDEEMQLLWARILASEANNPGAFSRRTVNLMADLDKRDAEMFGSLCGFCWSIGEVIPLVFDNHDTIYTRHGIDFRALIQLESLGLVQQSAITGFVRSLLPKRVCLSYFGKIVELTLPRDENNELSIGKVVFTQAGQELSRICDAAPVDGFVEFVFAKWAKMSPVQKQESESLLAKPLAVA